MTARPPGGAADGPRIKCPTCSDPCVYTPSNPWRPFCSERCRRIDLGAWASERFRVAGSPGAGQNATDPDEPS